MSGKKGRNAAPVIAKKLNSISKAIDKLTWWMSSLETKFETFENQLMTIDWKYSEKCSKLEAEISGLDLNVRGGVEDTRLEAQAKAKNTKKFRSQGQGQTLSRPRPRTKDTDASVLKKKVFKNFFQAISKKRSSNFFFRQKRSSKFFFRRSLLEETKKKVFADFPQGFWRFPKKFQRFKNSAVFETRTGQFSRTWGFEAKAKDFKMCPRGRGRRRGLHHC